MGSLPKRRAKVQNRLVLLERFLVIWWPGKAWNGQATINARLFDPEGNVMVDCYNLSLANFVAEMGDKIGPQLDRAALTARLLGVLGK